MINNELERSKNCRDRNYLMKNRRNRKNAEKLETFAKKVQGNLKFLELFPMNSTESINFEKIFYNARSHPHSK